MSPDNRSSTYKRWLQRVELACSIVVLFALILILFSDSAILNEVGWFVGYVVPGLLAGVALVHIGFDGYVLTTKKPNVVTRHSRWSLLGYLLATTIIGFLALATLFFIMQTILVVTVVDTGGGVILGPIFWMYTGSALAVGILFRSAVWRF